MTESNPTLMDHPTQTQTPTPGVAEFDSLYRESRDDLFSYLAYLVGDRSLAEELTAQAFERAFSKRRLFNRSRGDLRGWLFSIARNAAVDELRRGGRESALDLVPEPAAPEAPRDERLIVSEAMRRLRPAERELIALKFFAGLDNDQIARVLRVSRSNAGTQLHRAMTRLREAIGGAENVL